jgi:hypothetical protein
MNDHGITCIMGLIILAGLFLPMIFRRRSNGAYQRPHATAYDRGYVDIEGDVETLSKRLSGAYFESMQALGNRKWRLVLRDPNIETARTIYEDINSRTE